MTEVRDNQKSSGQQVRLIMWTMPRTIATALAKCLSLVEDSLIFYEPYLCADMLGPDAKTTSDAKFQAARKHIAELPQAQVASGFQSSQCSFKWVKEQLEAPHTDKKFIFCKDMAYSTTGHQEFLPEGYRHLFLVRHPLKVFSSFKRAYQFVMNVPLDEYQLFDMPPALLPSGYGFQEISELLDHVRKVCDQEAIIIDADDLLQDPKGTLSALFQAIGLPFDEKILHWEAGDEIIQTWLASNELLQGNKVGGYYKDAFDSTCFLKPSPLPDRSSLSSDILHCVDASMPYYEKLYAQRLIPS